MSWPGLIKDLCVNLTQIPAKCMVMDVVADVPPKYGMLLSRSWGTRLKGTMQMDGAYSTILIFSQLRRLYREAQMNFMVSSPEKPENSPLYSVHMDLDSFILCNDESIDELELEDKEANNRVEPIDFNIMANLYIEENEEETFGQCTESETQSKQNQDYKQLTGHLAELHTHHEEKNTPHHNADPTIHHDNEPNIREENDDKPENNPLWKMNFDGSCTRKNA